ncbi:MAG: sulfatase-like hydrolase/transferase, partial [Sciscionella sp.]
KWHLAPAHHTSAAGPYDQWPLQRGFERYYGFLAAATNHWRPALTYDNHHIDPPEEPGYHLTTDIIDHSIAFIRDQKALDRRKPFFLNLGFGACHTPHHAPAELVAKYEELFAKGWDRTRQDRLAHQKQLGIVSPETALAQRNDEVVAWEDLDTDARRVAVRLQAAYAGMLEHADRELGRLVTFLEQIGQLDNTLIMVLSDNGANREGSEHGTVNAMRYFNQVPDSVAANLAVLDQVGSVALVNDYPLGWAMAGNTPLKRYKGNAHGGGVRDPLLVHWPERIRDGGGMRHQFHHVIDLTPTVLEAIGVEAPTELFGIPQQPIEGTSLLYTFDKPEAPSTKQTQYFEIVGHRGIWHQGWKAVAWHRPGTSFDDDEWELYDLDHDMSESHDLAAEQPERLRALIELWWAEAGRHQVLPLNDAPRWFGDQASGGSWSPSHFEFLPGTGYIPGEAAPDLRNRSYTLTAHAELHDSHTEGMLLVHGDMASGYALYLRDGHLIHDYNFAGTHYLAISPEPVPTGQHALRFAFTATGDHAGVGTLWVDEQEVGRVNMPATLRRLPQWSGLYVGRNPLVPVGDYPGGFPFQGNLDRIVVDLGPCNGIDHDAHLASDLGAQ